MINFDADFINDLVATYLYEDIEGRDPEIFNYVQYLWEQLQEENWNYRHGEVTKVLNSFKMCELSEDATENKKAVHGVKADDVAFIATHYGFVFGMVYAENLRLDFWKG